MQGLWVGMAASLLLLGLLAQVLAQVLAQAVAQDHLATLPGFSMWQQHIQAVQQAEDRLNQRINMVQALKPGPSKVNIQEKKVMEQKRKPQKTEPKIKVPDDIIAFGGIDTKDGLKEIIKQIVRNNLVALREQKDKSAVELLLERTGRQEGQGGDFLDLLAQAVGQEESPQDDQHSPSLESLLGGLGGQLAGFNDYYDDTSEHLGSSDYFDREVPEGIGSEVEASDPFLTSLIHLLVENTDLEEEFPGLSVEELGGTRPAIRIDDVDFIDYYDTETFTQNEIETTDSFGKTFAEEEAESAQREAEETAGQLARLLADLEGE